MQILGHSDNGERETAAERNVVAFDNTVAGCRVQWFARKGRNQDSALETCCADGLFTRDENGTSNAASHPMRVDEERANSRRVQRGVERCIFARAIAVTAENRPPMAPAPAADDSSILFDDEIGSVPDQLTIHAKHWSERGFHLRSRVVGRLQDAHRKGDQGFQRRDIVLSRKA